MLADVRLGIDYGTSTTVAVLRGSDGRTATVLFDGSPLLPSAVLLAPDGRVLVGRDAVYSARAYPERFEPAPKRCIDDGSVLVGSVEIAVVDLIAATLRRVRQEAELAAGGPVGPAVLTYPAVWGPRRRESLLRAAHQAGLAEPVLLPEPVAAAIHHRTRQPASVHPERTIVVYDLGAGTFDCTVVGSDEHGFAVLATGGLPDAGGLDVDAAVMAYLSAVYAERAPQAWSRLERPPDAAARRDSRQLWEDIRDAKELLSRASSTVVHLPGLDVEAPLGREQLERLAIPLLNRTVTATRGLLREAGVDPADTALLLVGGASRMPLVATLLHRGLGRPPFVMEQPELVVALGSVAASSGLGAVQAATAVPQDAPDGHEEPDDQEFEDEDEDFTTRETPAHVIHLVLTGIGGYALRRYRGGIWDGGEWLNEDAEFLVDGGRLVLFDDDRALVEHVAASDPAPLGIDDDWLEQAQERLDAEKPLVAGEHWYDLDFALYLLRSGLRPWRPRALVPVRDLVEELAYALELDDVIALLDEDSAIDRLDHLLRASGSRLYAGRLRRQLDLDRVAREWHTAVSRLEAAVLPVRSALRRDG